MTWINLLKLAVVIALNINTCLSLQCYRCSYTKLETDNSVLDFFLGAINSFSDEHCKLERETDKTNVNVRNCPEPRTSGNVMKCFDVKGSIRTSTKVIIATVNFDIYTISRDCIEVSPTDQSTKDGCHDDLPSTAQNVIKDFYTSTISLGDMTLSGKACYSSGSLTNTGGKTVGNMWVLLGVLLMLLLCRLR